MQISIDRICKWIETGVNFVLAHPIGVGLNSFRYLICAAVSVVLHSVIGLHPPAQPAFAMSIEEAPQAITLRLMATPPPAQPKTEKKVEPQNQSKPEVKPLPEPKAVPKATPKVEPKPESKFKQAKPSAPQPKLESVEKVLLEQKLMSKEIVQKSTPKPALQDAAMPVIIEKPSFRVKPTPPHYPRAARIKGQQGVVMIEVWLDGWGRQTKLEIAESSGFDTLDKAAIAAVKAWQFKGHSINGQTMASRLKVPVRFELN
ncbi:MAG: TonB family protein [Enterovibrio sp.]